MSGWKDDDEVTTTYGSIQLSLEQAHAAGVKTERERIIELLEQDCGCHDLHTCIAHSFIAVIKGENK